jgi:hypothetical protein
LQQLPYHDLERRVGVLLNGAAPLLGPELAVRYVMKARFLRRMLADPEAAVQQLQERRGVYVQVLGVLPTPQLLAALVTSQARDPVQRFQERLAHLVQK